MEISGQPDGRLLLSTRWPSFPQELIDVGVVANDQGCQVDMADGTLLLRGRRSLHTRALMDRVCDFVEAASQGSAESSHERGRVVATESRLLRIGQMLSFASAIVLLIAGVAVPVGRRSGFLIAAAWLALVAPWAMEILKHRATGTSSRREYADAALLPLVGAFWTCAIVFLW